MNPRNSPGPRVAAALLAAVYIVALPAAITAAWIRGTVLSTSGYVAAVAPLAANPVVRATVRTTIDGEVSLVVSHAIKSAAPSPVSILAGPLSGGLGSLAGNGTGTLMASPEFQRRGWPPTPRRTARS